MSRTIWVCRHGERIDQIDPCWALTARAWDDPTLSEPRGIVQANEVGRRLASEHIDYIFASPFERCVQTAQLIVNECNNSNRLSIKLEEGICEALHRCQKPPGWLSLSQLKTKYPSVDETYKSIVSIAKFDDERSGNDDDCVRRLQFAIDAILERFAGNILLVSHGAPTRAIHQVLGGECKCVGLCTLSKFVMIDDGSHRWDVQLSGDSSHLSDQSNLRPH